MKLRPNAIQWLWSDRAKDIKERDWLTRFSYARGPLCRWPGATVDQVKEAVKRALREAPPRVG